MKIGLYGGTFSPPHNGHRLIADAFVRQCGLDLLIVMPASVPPHKRVSADDDPEKRLAMARLAFSDCEKTVVSRLELDRTGPSYTFDTLTELYGIYGHGTDENKISLLCGTDMFLSLDTWYRADEILRIADVVYAPRGEDGEFEKLAAKAELYSEKYGTDVKRLELCPYPISSSEIRRMIAEGDDVSAHVLPDVYDYIRKAGLYGGK